MSELNLIGIFEIAKEAGVSPSAVVNWRTRYSDFPNPVANLKAGPVFRYSDVRRWLRRKEVSRSMSDDAVRMGLRLLEFECGVSSNVDDSHSAELVDYELSRTAGQAARLAMLIRGQDVVEDEQRLKKVAAIELGLSPPEYAAARRYLHDVDLIAERVTRTGKRVLNEKVNRLNHADNYRRIGELWADGDQRSPKEGSLIHTLDTIIELPTDISSISPLRELRKVDREAVLELGTNAGIMDSVDEDRRIYYSPLLWDVHPKKLNRFLKIANSTEFRNILARTRSRPGTDYTNPKDPLVVQAVSGGVLPSYRVVSTGGPRVYGFAPYIGGLLSTDEEKTILDKARAIVACLRYGSEAATVTRIINPLWILGVLTDESRNYRLRPHPELKLQYGMLVAKQIGRVLKTSNGRFIFGLIPTDDNLRACAIAEELLTRGETLAEKDPASASLHLVNGTINHPLREVKVAKKKRPARADELADLIESIRSI